MQPFRVCDFLDPCLLLLLLYIVKSTLLEEHAFSFLTSKRLTTRNAQATNMPTKGLRYVNKVDLEKDAATEPFLHVCPQTWLWF